MNNILVLLKGKDARFVSAVNEAIGIAMPGATALSVETVEEATNIVLGARTGLLVIGDASPAEVSRATESVDALNLPQFAVVVCGKGARHADAEVVSTESWSAGVLSHVFRLSVSRHVLRRENLRFRGDLVSIGTRIVHDLRAPLSGILMAAESLSEYLEGKAPGEVAGVRRILDSEEDLLKVVRQLALLTRAFAAQDVVRTFDMGTAVAAALERNEAEIVSGNHAVVKPSAWPGVSGDYGKIEIIWILLLENAARHGGEGCRIELGWQHIPGGLRFSVTDDGTGVPPEERGRLYHPFHRLHEPGAARGLGLSIVDRLVRMQGGECDFEQSGTSGSSFRFTVPSPEPTIA
jgi:signal transduction histidine kinase